MLNQARLPNPLQDFLSLLRSPKRFFGRLRDLDASTETLWLIKALLGLFCAHWVVGFLIQTQMGLSTVQVLIETLRFFDSDLGAKGFLRPLERPLSMGVTALGQFRGFAQPFLSLGSVLLSAAACTLFLPLMGVNPRQVSFAKNLVILSYAQWLVVLALIPGTSVLVLWVVLPLFQIFAIRWAYSVGLFRAFLSVHLIHWLLALVASLLVLSLLPWIIAGLVPLGL
jgi:hypothetical protein